MGTYLLVRTQTAQRQEAEAPVTTASHRGWCEMTQLGLASSKRLESGWGEKLLVITSPVILNGSATVAQKNRNSLDCD